MNGSPATRRPVQREPSASIDLAATYQRHNAELLGYAVRICRDRHAGEDLVQEAFMRLFLEHRAGRHPGNVRAWLHRVVHNLAVSQGRRATVHRRYASALVDHGDPERPDEVVVREEERVEIATMLRTLPDASRVALLLAANGYSGRRISAAIGRSDAATRTLLCRGRRQLRRQAVTAVILGLITRSRVSPA
jgi:RNA polymerase sigma-70 factor (ECF subfamily)